MAIVFKDGIISKDGVNQGVKVEEPGSEVPVAKGPMPKWASNFLDSTGFGKAIRSKNIPIEGVNGTDFSKQDVSASFKKAVDQDWRVKLSVPTIEPFASSNLLAPLETSGGLCFPYTPTIIVAHSANYNSIAPTHTNYPYFAYQNSQVDQLVITGDFFVQNGTEAQYWVAALHYLRSITKMFYGGNDAHIGAPPPVVKLNGYGDFIFNNVPVIVTQFTVDLPQDVDYVATGIPDPAQTQGQASQSNSPGHPANHSSSTHTQTVDRRYGIGWAPAQSLITVTVQPIYSRREIEQFSLQKYVNGGYVKDKGGFI